jgi:NHL repeat
MGHRPARRRARHLHHPDDRVLLCDRDAHQVLCFDLDGKLLLALGERHRPSFQAPFNHPADAATTLDGDIVVADGYANSLVQVFSSSGEYLTSWGDFYHPMDIFIDRHRRTYVTDQIPRLSLLDADGTLIGRCRPVLYQPHGVWGDSAGNLYIAEPAPMNRLTRLTRLPAT